MKLILILLISISIISCSSDRKQNKATNALCTKSNLALTTYKPVKSKTVYLPSNPTKNDDDINSKKGTYLLSSSTVHVHDLSLPVPDEFETEGPEFLQFAITYNPTSQSTADKEENTQNFNGVVNCLSGLMPEHAGNLNYIAKVPTTLEVKVPGAEFISKTLSSVEFGYKADKSMNIIANPITDKSENDKIDEINPSDQETITNIYRTTPTSETYQLQSRVNQGDIVLTVINTYTRCVDPNEAETDEEKEKQKSRTQEETDILEKAYELCQSRIIKLNSKL